MARDKKKFILIGVFICLFVFSFLLIHEVKAVESKITPPGTLSTDAFLGYAGFNFSFDMQEGQDIRLYVVNLIKIVLTLVGFGFFILIFIGGYMWLTAAGNEENIKKAKAIITKAIVGFTIILVSYALAVFVATALVAPLQSATP